MAVAPPSDAVIRRLVELTGTDPDRLYTSMIESAFALQWCAETLEDIKGTRFYSQRLKNLVNQTQNEIFTLLKNTLYAENDMSAVSAMEQQENGLRMVRLLFGITFATDYLPDGQSSLFFLDINKVFIRYNLPVTVDANGVFSLVAPRQTEAREPGAPEVK